jgi:hypothetical protein
MDDRPNSEDEPGTSPDASASAGMPRWVKVFLIVLILVVVAFVISFLAGVRHGPGLHGPSSDDRGHVPGSEQGP